MEEYRVKAIESQYKRVAAQISVEESKENPNYEYIAGLRLEMIGMETVMSLAGFSYSNNQNDEPSVSFKETSREYRLTKNEMKQISEESRRHGYGYYPNEILKLFKAAKEAYEGNFSYAVHILEGVVKIPQSIDCGIKLHRYIVELLYDVNYSDSACLIDGARFSYAIKHYDELI